jgi:hypothetical protein
MAVPAPSPHGPAARWIVDYLVRAMHAPPAFAFLTTQRPNGHRTLRPTGFWLPASGFRPGGPPTSAQRPAPTAHSPRPTAGGIFSVPWGARWNPPHQKSTSNSAGSSVGPLALSTPPGRATPRLGGVYVSCQYFPCSFVLALRELGLRLGVKAQLPLRARQLPWSPPRGPERTVRFHLEFEQLAHKDSSRFEAPNRDREEQCIAPAWCCCGRAARFTLEPRDAPWVM